MSEAVIVDAVRTAIGRRGGKLGPVRPDDLLALTLREVVNRAGVDPAQVDDVIVGCVTQTGEQGMNIGRAAVLIAGFPVEVPGTTVNRFCGSGQQAVNFAAQGVMSGSQDIVIGAGVENMTRVPMGSDAFGPGEGPVSPKLMDLFEIIPQGNSAEMIAKKWGFSREQLDEFAFQSHVKAGQAIQDGRFKREIFPVEVKQNGSSYRFDVDEGVRMPPSREKMAQLKPAFQDDGGVVTAGNSSQISDGAAAVLVMSAEKAKALGLKPRARIVAQAIVGSEPTIMLTGPIPATAKVLKKAGLQIKDIDLFEVNEAFAPVVLAWQHETGADMEKVNYNGGAIALGHPLGASGARLLTTMLHELERQNARYGLSTMCIGYGMGIATIIERLN
ncbi:MAG: thiolase family protein [Candidatus Dormibacteraeota bacterium]|nr:thiolase family protein [Candidatus Dormibacteraeota bacterium]